MVLPEILSLPTLARGSGYGERNSFAVRGIWVYSPAVPLPAQVILGKSLTSESLSPVNG